MLDHHRFRVCAPRRDLPALRRGRPDLQSGLPGLAGSLSVRSGADDQDQRARRDQHAGLGKAYAKILQASTSEVYGDPAVHPQTEEYWGHVNPIGPRSCYDEGKRCAETLFFDYWRQHQVRIKVARIFNTTGRACIPTTAAWCRTSSCRHCRAVTSRFTATAADARVLLRRRPGRRPDRLMEPQRSDRTGQPGKSRENSPSWSSPKG